MTDPAKLLEKWWDESCFVAQMLRDRDAEIVRLRAALEEISQPLIAMQDRAKIEGYNFNGETALNIISNPEHYKSIARKALAP